jgi:hypothetical protein
MEFIKQEKEIYLDNQTTIEFLDKPSAFSKTTTVIIDRDRFHVAKSLQIENGKKIFDFLRFLLQLASSFQLPTRIMRTT